MDSEEKYIEMTDEYGAKFNVYAPENLLEELKEREQASEEFDYLKMNWGSFRSNDRFIDDEGNSYGVDVDGNVVQIYPL